MSTNRRFVSGESFGFRRFGEALQLAPKAGVQGNLRVESAGEGLGFVPCRPQLRSCRNRFEVPHHTQRVIEVFGGRFERQHGVGEAAFGLVGHDRVDTALRLIEQYANSRLHMLRKNLVEWDVESDGKQRIGGHLNRV